MYQTRIIHTNQLLQNLIISGVIRAQRNVDQIRRNTELKQYKNYKISVCSNSWICQISSLSEQCDREIKGWMRLFETLLLGSFGSIWSGNGTSYLRNVSCVSINGVQLLKSVHSVHSNVSSISINGVQLQQLQSEHSNVSSISINGVLTMIAKCTQ